MATLLNLTQLGSGALAEAFTGDASASHPPITAGTPPGGLPIAVGSYCFDINQSASADAIQTPQLTVTGNLRRSRVFYWYVVTLPSSGKLGLATIDNSLNGNIPAIDSADNILKIYATGTGSLKASTGLIVAANTLYMSAVVEDRAAATHSWELATWKYNTSGGLSGTWSAEQSTTTTSNAGNGIVGFIGNLGLGSATGHVQIFNVVDWEGLNPGQYGCIPGYGMYTGLLTTKETDATQIARGDGTGNDATTGAGDTEHGYINEVPPVDGTTSRLQMTGAPANESRIQWYKHTASLIPTGGIILGYKVWGRFLSTVINATTNNSFACGLKAGGTPLYGFGLPSSNTPTIPTSGSGYRGFAANVWFEGDCYLVDTLKPDGSAWATGSTDTDAVQIAHVNSKALGVLSQQISQLGITYLVGTAEMASIAPQAQVI